MYGNNKDNDIKMVKRYVDMYSAFKDKNDSEGE